MYNVFSSVKGLLKVNKVCIDNTVFQLHKFTMVILIVFSTLVTLRQYIGDPIDCFADSDIPLRIIDMYCWIYSTYTTHMVNHAFDEDQPYIYVSSNDSPEERRYHSYYQWVCFVLFLQGLLLYVPRSLWKKWEGGRIRMLLMDLDNLMLSRETKNERIKVITDYFIKHQGHHDLYFFRFFICEILNFLNVVGQIYFMDFFVGGGFLGFGFEFLNSISEEDTVESLMEMFNKDSPLDRIFPKMTKCLYRSYGLSGSVISTDGLCLLPQNSANEKIYLFLFFWYTVLSILSALVIVFRLCLLLFPTLRAFLLHSKSRLVPYKNIRIIMRRFHVGDWFVLHQLGENIHSITYNDLIMNLANELSEYESDSDDQVDLTKQVKNNMQNKTEAPLMENKAKVKKGVVENKMSLALKTNQVSIEMEDNHTSQMATEGEEIKVGTQVAQGLVELKENQIIQQQIEAEVHQTENYESEENQTEIQERVL